MEYTKIKQNLIIKPLKEVINHLIERGFEVKFKNINKIIEEVSKVLLEALNFDKKYILTMNIEMVLDSINTFKGEFILFADLSKPSVSYLKIEKNNFDFEMEQQKNFVGKGKIYFELSLRNTDKEKVASIVKFLKKDAKFIENFEILADVTLNFEVPLEFKVIKYLI
jgi:hypothetical protein